MGTNAQSVSLNNKCIAEQEVKKDVVIAGEEMANIDNRIGFCMCQQHSKYIPEQSKAQQ